MKTFYVKVGYTDATGFHAPDGTVNLPYDSDVDIAAAQAMVAYGVLDDRAPAPKEAPSAAPQPTPTAPTLSAESSPGKPVVDDSQAEARSTASVKQKGGRRS